MENSTVLNRRRLITLAGVGMVTLCVRQAKAYAGTTKPIPQDMLSAGNPKHSNNDIPLEKTLLLTHREMCLYTLLQSMDIQSPLFANYAPDPDKSFRFSVAYPALRVGIIAVSSFQDVDRLKVELPADDWKILTFDDDLVRNHPLLAKRIVVLSIESHKKYTKWINYPQ